MNKYIKYIFILIVLTVLNSCNKEQGISTESVGSEFLSSDGDINSLYVSPGGSTSNFGGFVDIVNGKLFLSDSIFDNFADIDLYFRYSDSFGNELYTTDSKSSYNRDLELMGYSWPYNNTAEIKLLNSISSATLDSFNAVKNTAQLSSLYDKLEKEINNNNPSTSSYNKRISNIEANSLVLFKSFTKNIKSIIYIDKIASSTTGRIGLSTKTDISTINTIPQSPNQLINDGKAADTLELTISKEGSDENYIDLLRRKVYKIADLDSEDISSIALIHVLNNKSVPTIHSFYTPTSTYIGSNYSSTYWKWVMSKPNRKSVYLLRLDVNSNTTIQGLYNNDGYRFEDVHHNNEDLKEYSSYIGYTTSYSSHITTTAIGMVYRIIDNTTGELGLMKILELDVPGGKAKIALKYSVPE